MIYALVIIVALVGALLVLRVRIRLELSSERKLLFFGLGRTGPELDFRIRRGAVKLFGLKLKTFYLGRSESLVDKVKSRLESKGQQEPRNEKTKSGKPKRTRSWKEVRAILPQSIRAGGRYLIGLFRAAIVEQAEAEIEAGFARPDLTGQLFGYYQAVLGAVPAVGRVQYTPVWTGPAFSGSANISIAWPVYRLVWQTTLLLGRLPIMKIVKLAIGRKEEA